MNWRNEERGVPEDKRNILNILKWEYNGRNRTKKKRGGDKRGRGESGKVRGGEKGK